MNDLNKLLDERENKARNVFGGVIFALILAAMLGAGACAVLVR